MDLEDTAAEAEYRAQVRAWVHGSEDSAPPLHGRWTDDEWIEARRAWQGRLAAAGYAGVPARSVSWVLDGPGADVLVVAATNVDGAPVAVGRHHRPRAQAERCS